ncbi:hypothetical protein PIB30_069227 [Stylosanthes scabra]|uniref:Uncharacterized protein n=1 Tax=Stylosanthes scabra TaxID=79078 RepID=A0ABU6ZLR6_9FABA|nr:hypothetical protein [Stylosanthes scabra]
MPVSSLGTISHSFVVLLDPIHLSECREFLFGPVRHPHPPTLILNLFFCSEREDEVQSLVVAAARNSERALPLHGADHSFSPSTPAIAVPTVSP